MGRPPRVLFLGETSLPGPARYLAAVLKWGGFAFDHREDHSPIPPSLLGRRYGCFILSDYPHKSFSKRTEAWLCRQAEEGAGLLMIGGWASYTGLVGGYGGTGVEELLPVRCVTPDDRVNCPGGSVVARRRNHPVLAGLSFSPPPVVCGYNRVRAKPGTATILDLRDLRYSSGRPSLSPAHPLLVLGKAGLGRSGAFMTDCAPHWCGGLVDWGARRVTVRLGRGLSVELGSQYLRFFSQLIRWLAGA